MNVTLFCKSYFNGFQEISNCRKTSYKISALAALKIISYFTVVIPLMLASILLAASLYDRVKNGKFIEHCKIKAKNRFEEEKAKYASSDMKSTSDETVKIIKKAEEKYNLSLDLADRHAKAFASRPIF